MRKKYIKKPIITIILIIVCPILLLLFLLFGQLLSFILFYRIQPALVYNFQFLEFQLDSENMRIQILSSSSSRVEKTTTRRFSYTKL
jgi:hypothetical protein